MINKLDPARKGMILGRMTKDERQLLKDAYEAHAPITCCYDKDFEPLNSPCRNDAVAYWTDWERPEELPAPPSGDYEVHDLRKVVIKHVPEGAKIWHHSRWHESSVIGASSADFIYAFPKPKATLPDVDVEHMFSGCSALLPPPPSDDYEVYDFRNTEPRPILPKGTQLWETTQWVPSFRVTLRAAHSIYAFPKPKATLPKAFEIDWGFVKPCVKFGNVYRDAHPGERVDGYRIFAYGDTPDYDEEEAEPAPVDPFGYCRKYAYGVIPR